ncbi:sulfatase-like hydrolase/transferase [Maribellus comscasis]|uniref:Sulfatase-like hydrolase/transferase n=1 Tax=Maribellus comscasis TaxID=2681766 RepID=A0A6I6JTM7_9BACT|nr:sulfatase-like hydrolase/transferase [Maribellus comscasis]QGY43482.1 sulfatase-like hydrolase/transferase [Maribellus comscasis]
MKHSSLFSVLLLLLLGFFSGCNTEKEPAKEKTKPNILFLFADDQRADAIGCANNTNIQTPNIDKLAETGVRFTNNYVMGGHHGAICAPSRAMLMSGKSLFHVYDHLEGVHTMPMHFAENGYETFGTGKWHNGANTFEASFQNGKNVFIGGMSNHFQVPCRDLGADGKLSEPVKKGFSTDLFADAALGFLDSYAKGTREKPFFCYVAFTAPHDPRSPREDYIGMYPDESIPLPGNFKKLHPFEFDNLNIRDETLAPWPRTPEIIQASLADYYALISHLDKRVGDIVEMLKKENLYENTIVVYAADNGLAVGSHGLLGKQNLYEHSTKVPLIMSGPGIPENEVRDALVYLYDIFPTLADLCGLPAPEGIDGKDLAPVLMGNEKAVRSSLYTVYRNTARAVRTDEWKLIRYPQRNYTQLFNLEKDPLEINNLAAIPEYKSRVNEMMQLLDEWYTATEDTATMQPNTILPLEYDYHKLKQTPDVHQPEYVLKKYFNITDE